MMIGAVDWLAREVTLFAAVFMAIGGVDDLLMDAIYIARIWLFRRNHVLADALEGGAPKRFAIFVPAWDESAVIEAMLRTTLQRWPCATYRLYAGTYPNDAATIAAVARVAAEDARVRLVVGTNPGPTTKADCLNSLWRALLRDEAVEQARVDAIVLHDAEDVVDPAELRVFSAYLDMHGAVQLPVVPLVASGSRMVSGHYLDEFAQAHGMALPVRQLLRASMPLAGVGCAIRRDLVQRIADLRGVPFDAASLTEDYELGITLRAMGAPCVFVRAVRGEEATLVAVRAFFPATLSTAVRQKARWMAGIALAGWDRTGWARWRELGDHWMRMRDRRVTLAMPVLALAYGALVLWAISGGLHLAAGTSPPGLEGWAAVLLLVNTGLLAWRLLMRVLLVGSGHGWREALWSIPRMLVANAIALLAARRALGIYIGLLRGGPLRWDKTAHHFPGMGGGADPAAA